LLLLIIDLQDQSVSRITGKTRLPLEVIDIIIFGSIAEELVFRGMIWSQVEKVSKKADKQGIILLGTSLLFGLEHLAYWAQSNWPLPLSAFVHSGSMVLAGIIFGILRMNSKSISVPVVTHMLANASILLIQ
jgi:membrane protease YdiL (CAAX protease family)